jgi:hypothetical protein
MDMIQDYYYAESVLQDLGYTKAEASKIIEVIKQGNYAFPCKKAESVDSKDLSKQHIWMQDECTGIDVPVLWKPNHVKSSKTIILLAQDPLRDNDYWDYSKEEIQHNKHVIIGTPYALHISEETKRTLVGTKQKSKRYNVGVYRSIIEALCKLDYNVYCTDIFKYYMRNTPCEEVSNFDVEIFANEYKRIGPVKIIAMGKSAQAAVAKLPIEQNKIISVLHPKARPQRTTEQIVTEIISKL